MAGYLQLQVNCAQTIRPHFSPKKGQECWQSISYLSRLPAVPFWSVDRESVDIYRERNNQNRLGKTGASKRAEGKLEETRQEKGLHSLL